MNGDGARFGEASLRLVGSPFRLHGRDPATGLDCVGVVLASLQAIGRIAPATPRYSLRNTDVDALLALLPQAGFLEAHGSARTGDLLLLKPSAGQFHLGIVSTGGGLIHAHASLGRVVETPPPLAWPMLRRWHLG